MKFYLAESQTEVDVVNNIQTKWRKRYIQVLYVCRLYVYLSRNLTKLSKSEIIRKQNWPKSCCFIGSDPEKGDGREADRYEEDVEAEQQAIYY